MIETKELVNRYFSHLTEEAYTDNEEAWHYYYVFLDLLCVTMLLQKEQSSSLSMRRRGCLLNDIEIVKALEPQNDELFTGIEEYRRIFGILLQKGMNALENGTDIPLMKLAFSQKLLSVELLALMMSMAVDYNRKYERVFGVLQENTECVAKPTVGLVHDLGMLFLSQEENDVNILLHEDSFLNRYIWIKTEYKDELSRLSKVLVVENAAYFFLSDSPCEMSTLSVCTNEVMYGEEPKVLCHEKQIDEVIRVYSTAVMSEGYVIEICGPEGCGRRFIMKTLAYTAEADLLCVDVMSLLMQDNKDEIVRGIVLKCILDGNILYLENITLKGEQESEFWKLLTQLKNSIKLIFIGTKQQLQNHETYSDWYVVVCDRPSAFIQKAFWQLFTRDYKICLDSAINIEELVSLYDMTPGRISEVLKAASANAEICGDDVPYFEVTKELLLQQIRIVCKAEFGAQAVLLESPFTWNDLHLTKESERLLKNACDRVRYRNRVLDEYGFSRVVPYGNGTSVVLYGPPGTGKTMAAQVMANELGLDIYRVDLSQIESKYIGETQKNIGLIFEAAKYSNAILFFDEADALFSKRTEISSSNDKYANSETAYLLQQIEEYRGICVLATNAAQNFDNAFKRRMTFMIPVEMPDAETRLAMWEGIFPESVPMEDNINWNVIAETAELSGSSIKSAALMAAYSAAAMNRKITFHDIVEAIDFEYRKTGRLGMANEIMSAGSQIK